MPELAVKNNSRIYKFIFDKKIGSVILKILITVGLLYYILFSVNLKYVYLTLQKANVVFVLLAVALTSLNLFLQFKKWQIACSNLLGSNDKKKIWKSLFYGIAAGSFTPVRVGEFFGRSIEFRDKSLLQVTFATLVDKFFLLFVISFFGSISSVIFLHYYYHIQDYLLLLILLGILAGFLFISFLVFKPSVWKHKLFNKILSFKIVVSLKEKLTGFKKLDKIFVFKMIVISVVFYAVFILQYAILVSAFSGNSNVFVYLWAGVLVMFTKSAITPFTFIDFGVREGASIFFLTKMGERSSVAFDASAMLFFINIIIPSIIGVILFYKRNNA